MTTILFLHGWGGSAASWGQVAGYFRRAVDQQGASYRVLTPSLPCPPERVYTLDDYADAVDRLLYDQQVTRCVVVAHSFGTRVVAILNARHPKLFTQIIITGGAGLPVRSWWVRWKIRWYKFGRRLGWRVNGGSADYQKLDSSGKLTFQNIVNRDLAAEVAQITAPTLLVWGARDRETPLRQMRRWQRLVPHAVTVIYRDQGHFAYLESAARFITDVTSFLRRGGTDA